MFLTCIYRSPSQSHDEFDDFCTKFDLLLRNININREFPLCSIVTEDFNARCSRYWQNDVTNLAGQEIDSLTLSAGYKQIIDKPIHVVNNSMSCIDLLFCTNQNTISNYGVDVPIFENIKSSLKQRSKMTKIYYKNSLRKCDHIKVLEKSTECTKKILVAKKKLYT